MYRIGVDVGGTNTDSAILDVRALDGPSRGVLACAKTPTSPDITSGIQDSIQSVLAKSNICKSDVLSVTIGTTHFVNAVVEADSRRLSRVAVVRLCGPYTRMNPPFCDFPAVLRRVVDGGVYYVDGGLEIDGREILPLDEEQIRRVVRDVHAAGVSTIALVGVFSPLDHSGVHEERCRSIMHELDPSLSIVCSRDIGNNGLLERENATILNASILTVAKKTINGFRNAMVKLDLSCPLYLTQNDGTLTDAVTASKFPIKTFASGPTNSAIGAAFLGGLDRPHCASKRQVDSPQVIVVDIGGTTTDVCALQQSGFPRQAPGFVEVGGVRTAFSMPEICSVGLGGGSKVVVHDRTGKVSIGPDSVGHFITSKALVFGGDVLTTTDIAVALGKAEIGNAKLVVDVPQHMLDIARQNISDILKTVIDDMKVSAAPVTVLLVGGGSVVFMDEIEGVTFIRPPHHDSANAVGAAIAKVAGEVDIIEIPDGRNESSVVADATARAIEIAVANGAAEDTIKVVEVEKIPLQYVTNKATRIMVKAVGSLTIPKLRTLPIVLNGFTNGHCEDDVDISEGVKHVDQHGLPSSTKPSLNIDIPLYRPDVRNGVWYLSEIDVEFITSGTGVLGTGGGGSSYLAYLACLDSLRSNSPGTMRVISPKALKDSDLVSFGSWYGAPSVGNERIPAGTEIQTAIDTVNRVMGYNDFQALMADEIGGGNGLASLPIGCHYDRPVVDADGMGRAYPTMEHSTIYIYGHPILPCAISDANGNVAVVMGAESNARVEKLLRTASIELGLGTAVAARPLPGSVIKDYAVPNTVSQAWYLGRAIHMARKAKLSYVKAILEVTPGKLLFSGKVIDVRRDVQEGYTTGCCVLAPLSEDETDDLEGPLAPDAEKRHLLIPFQNEYLYAAYTDKDGISETEPICTVPDLISVLGQDGEAIGSQDLRYGLKVNVIGMPAHPLWTGDERGLKIGGPEGFGLQMKWKSVGAYEMPRSVIDDFDTCPVRNLAA